MIASKIENVDFEGDIRDFILSKQSLLTRTMTVAYICHSIVASSVTSPRDKICRPPKRLPLEITDLASRKLPHDLEGNQDPLEDVLVTRAVVAVVSSGPDKSTGAAPETDSSPKSDADATPTAGQDKQLPRVCLAEDVARVIAKAYEIRAVKKSVEVFSDAAQDDDDDDDDGDDGDDDEPEDWGSTRGSRFSTASFQSNDVEEEDYEQARTRRTECSEATA